MKCMLCDPEIPQLESPYKQTLLELFTWGFLHVIRPIITSASLKSASEELCLCSTLKTSLSATEGQVPKWCEKPLVFPWDQECMVFYG